MELNIGSNVFRDTNGILFVDGREQISLEIGDINGKLLLNMDIYDEKGEHLAKLHRNSWSFVSNKDRFEITTNPEALKLIDNNNGNVIIEANVVNSNEINILNGRFYSHNGLLIEVTPEYATIANMKMSRNIFAGCKKGVVI